MSAAAAVETGDRPGAEAPAHRLVLVLDHLRSAYNVGNIFRLAECCRLEGIVTCGYTATPPHPKLEKTARGCDRLVPCEHAEDTAAALADLRARGYHVVGVETVAAAPAVWDYPWQFPCALVFGNEAHGIAAEALALCHGFARLPVFGHKNSLNVSNCAAVAVYAALAAQGI